VRRTAALIVGDIGGGELVLFFQELRVNRDVAAKSAPPGSSSDVLSPEVEKFPGQHIEPIRLPRMMSIHFNSARSIRGECAWREHAEIRRRLTAATTSPGNGKATAKFDPSMSQSENFIDCNRSLPHSWCAR